MPVEPQDREYEKILPLFDQADDATKCVMMLLVWALKRGDYGLASQLEYVGRMKRPSVAEEDIGEPDFELMSRLRACCPMDETPWWARAFARAYFDGDRARKDALSDAAQRRLAS